MDNEVLSVLKEIQKDIGSLKSDVGSLKADVSSLKTDVNSLKTGQERLETKVDKIYNYLEDVDAKQSTNHLELINKFTETNSKISNVQIDVNNLGVKIYSSDNMIIEMNRKLNIVK